jgi:hypothetical protein
MQFRKVQSLTPNPSIERTCPSEPGLASDLNREAPSQSAHSETMEKKMATEKVNGPATYFPSIEQKYGKPIDYWLNLVRQIKDKKHMEIVALLKADQRV